MHTHDRSCYVYVYLLAFLDTKAIIDYNGFTLQVNSFDLVSTPYKDYYLIHKDNLYKR